MKLSRNAITAVMLSAAILVSLSPDAKAGGTIRISGTITCSNVVQQALPFKPAEGSLLLLEKFHCTNQNHGPTGFMDRADVINEDVAALFQGNGSNDGYITFADKSGAKVVAKWSGEVQTVVDKGKPNISLFGTWEHVQGTGQYQSIQGRGGYHGYFTSPKDYVVDWNGEYTLPVASK